MSDGPVTFNGVKHRILEQDGRYNCCHALIENVEYEWLTQVNGDTISIPIDAAPPAVICGRTKEEIKECVGRHYCGHYLNYFEGATDDE